MQTLSINESSVSGLQTWQTLNGLTTAGQIAYGGGGNRTETSMTPDGVQTVSQYQNDLLVSKVVSQASMGALSSTTYSYDPDGRMISSTDARNGTTTFTYCADDKVQTTTTPIPDPSQSGPGYAPQTTTYAYDAAGRVSLVTQPDGTTVSSNYFPTGLLQETFGSRTYHQKYSYDSQGRVATLSTWQNDSNNSGVAVTTWSYDPSRGWLNSKTYADGNGPSYTYLPSGRLGTRTWARGVTTTYSYNNAGDLAAVTYSDSTPTVSLTYTRLGQLLTTADAAGTCTYTYDPSGQLQNESYGTTGLLAGNSITRSFDSLDRLGSFSLGSLPSLSYTYDSASRIQALSSGSNSVSYSYQANSNLIGTITFQSGGAQLTTNRVYDNLGRITSVTSTPSTGAAINHTYTYNAANQRTQVTREDGNFWQYGYDALGQITASSKNMPSGATIGGYAFTATYDTIGNRLVSTVNDQPFSYAPNLLNQYGQRTVPGIVDVVGSSNPNAIVTANFQHAVQQGSFFYDGLTVNNTSAPQYVGINIEAVVNNAGPTGQDAIMQATRSVFVPRTPEIFSYDLDGNLISDGRWSYTWDAENRLIAMQTLPAAIAAAAPNQRIAFAYDSQGRRIQKTAALFSNGVYSPSSDLRFAYDGWNLLAEFDALHGNALLHSYTWGLDLSGSLQGAGGVGGLLEIANGSLGTSYFAATDGNGNVAGLVSVTNGSICARYEYGAYGEPIQTTGAAAEQNPIRFSTKYTDSETDNLYYGQRYYNPGTGRWLSRDPAEEAIGGVNLFGFAANDPVDHWDYLGMLLAVDSDFEPTTPINASWQWGYAPYFIGAWTGAPGQEIYGSGGGIEGTVSCDVAGGLLSSCNCVECKMVLKQQIYRNKLQTTYTKITWPQEYGHEQRHVGSLLSEFRRVRTLLEREQQYFQSASQANDAAVEYTNRYQGILNDILTRESNHQNPNSPQGGVGYPPLSPPSALPGP